MQTAYGKANGALASDDLVDFLAWQKQMRRIREWSPVR
jgi:hypothetical protein